MSEFQSDTDEAYIDRNQAFLALAKMAQRVGYECGIGHDPNEPDWPFVFIELPTGQVSSHFPKEMLKDLDWISRYDNNHMWDGHDVDEKRRRMEEFIYL